MIVDILIIYKIYIVYIVKGGQSQFIKSPSKMQD